MLLQSHHQGSATQVGLLTKLYLPWCGLLQLLQSQSTPKRERALHNIRCIQPAIKQSFPKVFSLAASFSNENYFAFERQDCFLWHQGSWSIELFGRACGFFSCFLRFQKALELFCGPIFTLFQDATAVLYINTDCMQVLIHAFSKI